LAASVCSKVNDPPKKMNLFWTILDWLTHWRFNLWFWAGLILALIAIFFIPSQPLCWIVAGLILLTCWVIGIRWDWKSG
jgi:hypothetical protein